MSNFKATHSFEQRKGESTRIRSKYPDRIPVIVEKAEKSTLGDIDKHKFLVPNDLSVAQFVYIIRKRLKLTPEKAIFLFVNNNLPPTSESMSVIYKNFKDDDGFIYFLYNGESTFGF